MSTGMLYDDLPDILILVGDWVDRVMTDEIEAVEGEAKSQRVSIAIAPAFILRKYGVEGPFSKGS